MNKASLSNTQGRGGFQTEGSIIKKNIGAGIHETYLRKREYLISIECLVGPGTVPNALPEIIY